MPQTYIATAPEWELASEYVSLDSEKVKHELQIVEQNIEKLKSESLVFQSLLDVELSQEEGQSYVQSAQTLMPIKKETTLLIFDLLTYARLRISKNSRDQEAKLFVAKMKKKNARFQQAIQPLLLFLNRISTSLFEAFVDSPQTREYTFLLSHARKHKDHLLPLAQENLITSLNLDGHSAWSNLYNTLTGHLSCQIDEQELGLAQAMVMLGHRENSYRQKAYDAIHQAFEPHLETCAAILNAIAGWRLEICEQRSHTISMDFLQPPLHMNRIDQETLDTMMTVAEESRELTRHACLLQAQVLGKNKPDPWDLQASAPLLPNQEKTHLSFEKAMDLIVDAFNGVNPEMGQFARMMQEKHWIEALNAPHKSPGAFCAKFHRSRSPRVFMTFSGTMQDAIVLAHELGHAFHNWVMRDLPNNETKYTMSLAETASTFAEKTVRDFLFKNATSTQEKLDILWQEVAAIPRFLINIPIRYAFEKEFYKRRSDGPLTPDTFKQLMSDTWMDWYGPSISQPDPIFWASKLHFYLESVSFYNFPYTFGYLFSQGIYAQREKQGGHFYHFYTELLRDTGRMYAEDLVQKHLGTDLRKPDFWRESVQIVKKEIIAFEGLICPFRRIQP